MKEEVLSIVSGIFDPAMKLNLMREYIQSRTLRSLHESEAFRSLSFVGGTALRFLYGLPRFSEDLNFSLESGEGYKPELWMKKLKNDLFLAGFNIHLSWNARTNVHKAWIGIEDLMKEAGLAVLSEQRLSIKLEVDTNPLRGAVLEKRIITRYALIAIQHHDLPSLMAGKIHAMLARKYPKGRDWYDLLWYRGHRPPLEPNEVLLQKALDQTEGEGVKHASQWKQWILKKAGALDVMKLAADVRPFLERQEDAALITSEGIRSVLT